MSEYQRKERSLIEAIMMLSSNWALLELQGKRIALSTAQRRALQVLQG
jgi:uncharacterized membrane protein (DUF2068 family)